MTESITIEELAQTPTGQQIIAEREAQVEEAAAEDLRVTKLAEFTIAYEKAVAALETADANFAGMVEAFYSATLRLREATLEYRHARTRVSRHGGTIEKPRARHEKAYYSRLRALKNELMSLMTLP